MKIGILCEGIKDEKPLDIIVHRIVEKIKPKKIIETITFPADGPIESKIGPALTSFFEINDSDITIIFSDCDFGKDIAKEHRVLQKANELNPLSKPIIYSAIIPEFEQWFFDEENAIKRVLNISGSKKILFDELNPKERVNKLFEIATERGYIDYGMTIYDIYNQIAREMDLEYLSKKNKCQSFHKFMEDLSRIMNSF